ncbi:hypothetical protein GGU10DRAFT_433861 [Lentinula aff. detonsa]|uniref:Uncharacterized protein n=1 Tax=Lentinula aff. detonsa TaxID=2804958 RepID=A0AA38NPS4_9AGAR|nr:hypothetical protein GGU10DRAFT_433861 [Lentinula aff. detonsa]
MSSYPRTFNREAGLPNTFYWHDSTSSTLDEPEAQVLEQAQSSRWSLSTAGTPLEGFFPSKSQSFSRLKLAASAPTSDLRAAKSPYDEPSGRRTFLTKTRRDDALIPRAKKFHPLTVTVDVHEGSIGTKGQSPASASPIHVTPISSNSVTSPIDAETRWKRRKNSLGKIVHYPTKILGKILPKRVDSPKESVAPPRPKALDKEPQRLRRAETAIRRPRRSSELQRPDEHMVRWSIASTQAIRAERFSIEPNQRSQKAMETHSGSNVRYFTETTPPPLPALARSLTQPRASTQRCGEVITRSDRVLKRSRSERRDPGSDVLPVPILRKGLASESYHPQDRPRRRSSETSSETVATIANRIVAQASNQHHHDSWDFLDYYTQSSNTSR